MPKSHFSGVVVAREANGRPEVLVQPYLYRGEWQVKFPGGMNQNSETPAQTAMRELSQETNLLVSEEALVEVHEFTSRHDREHTKYFFATTIFKGSLRAEPIKDNGGEELLPPDWTEVTRELVDCFFGQHKVALERAIPVLGQKLEAFYWKAKEFHLV